MRLRARTTLTALGVAGALTFAGGAPAEAALLLYATVGGSNFCAADNQVIGVCAGGGTFLPDIDADLGQLDLGNGTLAGLEVTGSFHQQSIATVPGGTNILQSGSTSIANPGDGTGAPISASVLVSATNFLGPSTSAETTGSGTWTNADGSTIQMRWYNDPANAQGAESAGDTPGTLLNTFNHVASGLADSFDVDPAPFAVVDPALFSMTIAFDLTLEDGGFLTSRGQSELKPRAAVPEPFLMTMVGIGLAAAGRRLRRRA